MNRVFIYEKLIHGRRHAVSCETAETVRREGAAMEITDTTVEVRFDHTPGVWTKVPRKLVHWLQPDES